MQDWVYYGIIAALFLFGIICLFLTFWAKKAERCAKQSLKETVSNLEAVYSEVNTTQEELNAKYRELKASEDRIKKLAYEDAMTGLPNRTAFCEVLEHTLETLRKEESIGIMFLDLDNFKSINDMWSHSVGDELILDISHRIRQNLDENDYLARNGSDEFLILTQNMKELSDYEEKVKRLQKAFHFPFVLSVGKFRITISVGIVLAPKDGKNVNTLLKRIDGAVMQAKRQGKNTYYYFDEQIEKKLLEDMELKSELTAAIKQELLTIQYQPIFDLKQDKITELRVELRWDRKERGILRARQFVSFAEETGQILAIGKMAFRKVCKDLKVWRQERKDGLFIIIPVSLRQFLDDNFEDDVIQITQEEKEELGQLIFELSEEMLLYAYPKCRNKIIQLAEKGFQFRLGNFGMSLMPILSAKVLPFTEVGLNISYFSLEEEEFFQKTLHLLDTIGHRIIITELEDGVQENMVLRSDVSVLVQGELYGSSFLIEEAKKRIHGGMQNGLME